MDTHTNLDYCLCLRLLSIIFCISGLVQLVYWPGLVFVSLLALDIGSHWLQMYRKVLLSLGNMPTPLDLCCRTFLTGKTSHKDVKDSTNWLFKAYYGNRMFMGYCSVTCSLPNPISYCGEAERKFGGCCGECCASGFASFLPSCFEFIRMGNQANDQCHTVGEIDLWFQMKTAADVCALLICGFR
ncbi:hypothetical protein CISIN_1g029413mg [Citrus sinensis]|uniref:Uncharacterized protein n=3 Tax=Citrus sinensis TaxID=2711 RepID=A0A067D9S3_CITSI|nr:hypothetical protein CISIN_1g029413mg [Citrus sinensis]